MGCAASKLEEVPAVALCRDRCNLIEQALRQSYVLADAHAAYMHSLNSVGFALLTFFNHQADYYSLQFTSDRSHGHEEEEKHNNNNNNNNNNDKDRNVGHHQESSKETISVKPVSSGSDDYDNIGCNAYRFYSDKSDHFGGFSESEAPPPPPPQPPGSSAWDFLNIFEMDNMYGDLPDVGQYGSGWMDAEGVDFGEECKFVGKACKGDVELVAVDKVHKEKVISRTKRSNEVAAEEEGGGGGDGSKNESENGRGKMGVSEVMREIRLLFERAAESGNEILGMLDVGKSHFHQKSSVQFQQVSSKMLHAFSPSMSRVPSTTKSSESSHFTSSAESLNVGFAEDIGINLSSLSSTLEKLCIWEKKLYNEVKVEEKLCIAYQTKSRQLKHLDTKGAKPRKVEEMQNLLKTITTKIKIAIQVVDNLSITVNKLRDEELWPRITEFIQGLYGMWKAVSECHESQFKVAAKAKDLDAILCNRKLADTSFEAALQLRYELMNWSLSFSSWIRSQKDFVKSLNNWLLKCFLYQPEGTYDGVVPLSPDRMSPVLVICNHWSQVLAALSDQEIIETMNCLFLSVDELLKQHYVDIQKRIDIDINMERKLKNMEREEQKYQKIMQAQLKKMMHLMAGESNAVLATESRHQTEVGISNSSYCRLKLIFEALNKFTTNSVHIYEELSSQIKVGQPANPENQ